MVSTALLACTALCVLMSPGLAQPRSLQGLVLVLPEDGSMTLADPASLGQLDDYDDSPDHVTDGLPLPDRASLLNLEARYNNKVSAARHLRSLRTSSSTGREVVRGAAQKRALSIFMALPNQAAGGGTFSSGPQEPETRLERGGAKPIRPFGMPLRWG